MAEETISEAPAIESGAETKAGITTMEDLAASFTERVESEAEEAPSETEAEEATEATEAEAAEGEEDVLSQSISKDEDDEEGEAEEESEEEESEEESSEDEPEAESPAVGRLLKQVGKLTARAKGAEEQVEAMQAEIQGLKTQETGEAASQAQGSPVLDDVKTLEDLDKVRKEALSAKKWALQHLGKEYVESDGKEYDGDQIRDIFAAADEYLTEKIPARSQFLENRKQWETDAHATFPWLEAQDGELFDLYSQVRGSDQYGAILDALPNGTFVGATLARGIKSIQEEQAATKKSKKKSARAKPPPSQEGDAAPPVQSKESRKADKKRKSLGTGDISESQLAAYLT